MEVILGVLLFWLPCCILVAWIAGQKRRSRLGFFLLSALLSPIIGFLAVLAVPARVPPSPKVAARAMRKCPECAEAVLNEATKCKHCGSALSPVKPPGVLKSLLWGPVAER